MTDYNKLTDHQINRQVALFKFNECIDLEIYNTNKRTITVVSQGIKICGFDPCNNPNDWFPLLQELRELGDVSISEDVCSFTGYRGLKPKITKHIWDEPNLGRAICILWLMVKDGEG